MFTPASLRTSSKSLSEAHGLGSSLGMPSMSPGGSTGPCDTTARNTPASTSSPLDRGRDKGLCLAVLDDLQAGPGAWAAFVKKGEHGSPVVYASKFTKKDKNEAGDEIEQEIPFLKEYTVFNADQVRGLARLFLRTGQGGADQAACTASSRPSGSLPTPRPTSAPEATGPITRSRPTISRFHGWNAFAIANRTRQRWPMS